MDKEKIQIAIDTAFAIDAAIASLNAQLSSLISDFQREGRLHESGTLIGLQNNLRDSFYRKAGGLLQDMQS